MWKRLARGIIKLNFDASFRTCSDTGMGMVTRNDHGEVMASATCFPLSTLTPLLVVALTMRWTLGLAVDLGFRWVQIKTDCLQLLQAWKKGESGLSYLNYVLRDYCLFVSAFDVFSFSFVRWSGNSMADFFG